ncbi:hypothetical protein [Vagococcus fluvialis]|uniref:hypothetical protein n=1 Tax=Vagococcus fluvialis TaxID=2738 RepID=UPI003B2126AE
MKAIHRSRIDGLIILALIIGVVGGKFIGWTALLMIIPIILLWLFEYDINSHEHKKKTDSPASHNQSSH